MCNIYIYISQDPPKKKAHFVNLKIARIAKYVPAVKKVSLLYGQPNQPMSMSVETIFLVLTCTLRRRFEKQNGSYEVYLDFAL